jgi:hypothetical protein
MRTVRVKRPGRRRLFLEQLESRQLLSGSPVWEGYGRDEHHTATSAVASQSLETIRWQTPVDLQPQYSGNDLFIHYGSPMITAANTVVVPVKVGATDGFRLEAHDGGDGTLKWFQSSDYILPDSSWTPAFDAVITPQNRLYFAGAGGTLYYIDDPDGTGAVTGHVAFYGFSDYQSNPGAFDSTVFIDTPLTSDSHGNVYFGFRTQGDAPAVGGGIQLQSGIARIAPDGTGTWISAAAASGDAAIGIVPHSAAPALSNDETTLYVSVRSASTSYYGYLLGLDPTTLTLKQSLVGPEKVFLNDPRNGGANPAGLLDISTASPLVGPDGDVFYGVFGNPYNGSRGWMLHFNSDLSVQKTPGAFGWDDTGSIVPASAVPGYTGTSSYLIMTKYNNYAGGCCDFADGVNKIAILDPNATQVESHASSNGLLVMKEVMTIAGVTPDEDFINSGFPNAVREWCINTAVVDPATKSVLANSEDGKLYRWDLTTNTFSQVITLTSGIGEAYTPTMIGADGTVYAINNATLFAVGALPRLTINDVSVIQSPTDQTEAVFTITAVNPTMQTISVDFTTADDTAVAGRDYTFTTGNVVFPMGESSQTISVPVLPSMEDSPNLMFRVLLSNPTNAAIGDGEGVGTIVDQLPPPTITVSDASAAEGDSSTTPIDFTISLSQASRHVVTVTYTTADDTARAPRDYIAIPPTTVTFNPGETSKTVEVLAVGNTVSEADKTFSLVLSTAVNGTIGTIRGTGTILNDDGALTITDVTGPEGDSGTQRFIFNVRVVHPSTRPISVDVMTVDGTAHAPADYVAVPLTTLNFAPRQGFANVTVLVNGNRVPQSNRNFTVRLSNPTNAVLARSQGVGTIVDDDLPGSFSFSAPSYSVSEAQSSVTITVTRTGGSLGAVTVDYTASGGSAPSGVYVPVSGTLSFADGETTKIFTVSIVHDSQVVVPQTVNLVLSNPTGGASLGGQSQAVLNIIEIDGTPNQRFLMQVYRDLLGREVDGAGFGGWTGLLDRGVSRSQVVSMIEDSEEYHVRLINSIYLQYLGRAADINGLAMGLGILATPHEPFGQGGGVNRLRSIILGSPEYYARRGGSTDSGFIQALYQDVLKRMPDPSGETGLEQFLADGGSRTEAARRFLVTLEAGGALTTQLFNQYLHRTPSSDELIPYEFAFLREELNELDATAVIVGSPEYFARI